MKPIVSVVDPESVSPDPDPTFQVDPDPNRDPRVFPQIRPVCVGELGTRRKNSKF